MARVCQVTGKKPMVATTFRTPTTGPAPVPAESAGSSLLLESEKRWVRLRLTNAGLRTIEKQGIDAVLADLRGRGEI